MEPVLRENIFSLYTNLVDSALGGPWWMMGFCAPEGVFALQPSRFNVCHYVASVSIPTSSIFSLILIRWRG
jgi:hypothetical protein